MIRPNQFTFEPFFLPVTKAVTHLRLKILSCVSFVTFPESTACLFLLFVNVKIPFPGPPHPQPKNLGKRKLCTFHFLFSHLSPGSLPLQSPPNSTLVAQLHNCPTLGAGTRSSRSLPVEQLHVSPFPFDPTMPPNPDPNMLVKPKKTLLVGLWSFSVESDSKFSCLFCLELIDGRA